MSGTITSTGLGSGIDIESIVEGLVSAEGTVKQSNLTAKETELQAELSSVSLLKSALVEFEDSLDALTQASSFNAVSAVSSNEQAFTLETDSSAQLGAYDIEVQALASAHKLVNTQSYSGGSSGTLTFSQANGDSFSISIDDSSASLSDIAEAINSSADNAGITATVITTDAGEQLVLTANETGEENRITSISTTSTTGDLSVFDYTYDELNGGDNGLYTQTAAAQDASIMIDGQTITSSSNEISGAIEGVTLQLQSETESAATLSISRDTTAIETLITNFVDAYNTLQSSLSSMSSYDADTETAGTLFGDAMTRTLKNQITRTLTGAYGNGTINALSSLGIRTQADGSLEITDSDLSSALKNNLDGVTELFSGENGLASTLADKISTYTKDNTGLLDSRVDSLNDQIDDVEEQADDLEAWLSSYEDRLYSKFNAMDTTVALINSQGDFLLSTLQALTDSLNSSN